jgi:FKBP-type peptidyl-prolyl cis-trans isomerase FkpA
VIAAFSGLARIKIFTKHKVETGFFDDVDLVVFPGGDGEATAFRTVLKPNLSDVRSFMQRGGKYRLWIPAKLGYGPEDQRNPQTGQIAIPGGSELTFDVELLEFKSRAEIEAMQKQMQEMQKQQGAAVGGQGGGAPQGLPPEIQQQIDAQMQAQQGQGPAQ